MASTFPQNQLPPNVMPLPGLGGQMPGCPCAEPQVDPMSYQLHVDHGEYGLPVREIKHAKEWEDRIKQWQRADKAQFKKMEEWRKYAAGGDSDKGGIVDLDIHDDLRDNSESVRANLVHATFKSLLPATAAKNPEVAISPTEKVNEEEYKRYRPFCRTGEIFLNHAFRSGRYKRQLRRNTVSANTTGLGWMKATYQRDYFQDPLITTRIEDAQDNVAHVRQLIAETDPANNEIDADAADVKMSELTQVIKGLEEQVEVQVAEGFVFDRIPSDQILVDMGVDELDDYREADAIVHVIYLKKDKAAAQFGLIDEVGRKRINDATLFFESKQKTDSNADVDIWIPAGVERPKDAGNGFVKCYEIWCRRDQVVYTVIAGMKGWAKEPWRPAKQGRRWYPFFLLQFNEVDGRRFPLSDTELMLNLVDEYNETRSNLREHRNRAVPLRVGKRGDISDQDARAINNAVANELVLIDGPDDETKPISNTIEQLPYNPIDPNLYDVTQARVDLDQVVGSTDLNRGVQTGQRTATAAAIQNEGMQARTTDRQDSVEDFTQELAEFVLQVGLMEMSFDQLVRIAGEGAVWPGIPVTPTIDMSQMMGMLGSGMGGAPGQMQGQMPGQGQVLPFPGGMGGAPGQMQGQMPGRPGNGQMVIPGQNEEYAWINEMTKEDIFDLVMVEVRAGSTGRPNRQIEQQTWMQLWPLISQTMGEVYQLRMSMQEDMATAKIELLKEMLRRLDERLDVERFIPDVDPMQAQMMMQMAMGGRGRPGEEQGQANEQQGGGLIQPAQAPPMAA